MGIFFRKSWSHENPNCRSELGTHGGNHGPIFKWKVHQANNEKYWVFAPQLFPTKLEGFFLLLKITQKKNAKKKCLAQFFVLGEGARPKSILQKILGQNEA